MVKTQPCPHGAESLPGVKVQQQVLLKVTEPVNLGSRCRPMHSSSEVAGALGIAAWGVGVGKAGAVSMSSLRTEFRDSYLTLVSTLLLECCCLVTACCTECVTSTVYHPNFFSKIAHCSPGKVSLPHTLGAQSAGPLLPLLCLPSLNHD